MPEDTDSNAVGCDTCGHTAIEALSDSPLIITVAAIAAVILSLGAVILSCFIAWMCFQKPDAANIIILGIGGAVGAVAAKNATTVIVSKLAKQVTKP